jgi:trehalose 6-phosphate synthase
MVSPADVEGTAEAIYEALTMPSQERQRRSQILKRAVERDDVTVWFRRQLADIASTVAEYQADTETGSEATGAAS